MIAFARLVSIAALTMFTAGALTAAPLRILLLTGESNRYHDWTKSSPLVKTYLGQTGLFAIDVVTAPAKGVETSDFQPRFSDYTAVVMDYETMDWPAATKAAFVDYMKGGGGLGPIHAADNAFPNWPEFNEMIGIGGWRNRTQAAGPYWYIQDGKLVSDPSPGPTGQHGARLPFQVVTRQPEHPIMRGLPAAC